MKISNRDFQESRAAIPKEGKHKFLSYRKPRRNADLMLSKPLFELQKVVQSHSTVSIEMLPPFDYFEHRRAWYRPLCPNPNVSRNYTG